MGESKEGMLPPIERDERVFSEGGRSVDPGEIVVFGPESLVSSVRVGQRQQESNVRIGGTDMFTLKGEYKGTVPVQFPHGPDFLPNTLAPDRLSNSLGLVVARDTTGFTFVRTGEVPVTFHEWRPDQHSTELPLNAPVHLDVDAAIKNPLSFKLGPHEVKVFIEEEEYQQEPVSKDRNLRDVRVVATIPPIKFSNNGY